MTLIDFRQLWMLLTVVLSCENIASNVTVLRLLTSSRLIVKFKRRCYGMAERQLDDKRSAYADTYRRSLTVRNLFFVPSYNLALEEYQVLQKRHLRLLNS